MEVFFYIACCGQERRLLMKLPQLMSLISKDNLVQIATLFLMANIWRTAECYPSTVDTSKGIRVQYVYVGSICCLDECQTIYKFTHINVRIVFACCICVPMQTRLNVDAQPSRDKQHLVVQRLFSEQRNAIHRLLVLQREFAFDMLM